MDEIKCPPCINSNVCQEMDRCMREVQLKQLQKPIPPEREIRWDGKVSETKLPPETPIAKLRNQLTPYVNLADMVILSKTNPVISPYVDQLAGQVVLNQHNIEILLREIEECYELIPRRRF